MKKKLLCAQGPLINFLLSVLLLHSIFNIFLLRTATILKAAAITSCNLRLLVELLKEVCLSLVSFVGSNCYFCK